MKKKFILPISLLVILSGCVSQDKYDTLQSDYDSLEVINEELQEEVTSLTETVESLEESKTLYDQNKDIIEDAQKQEDLIRDIALKEQEVSELDEKLEELKGNIQVEEEQIEKEKEEGVVLQDDDRIQLNYMSESNGTLTFYIVNKTDVAIDIFPEYLAVNGTSYSDIYVYEVVAPNTSTTFKVEIDDYSENEDIHLLGGRFKLLENDSFSNFHNIEFNDVTIRI
jgi:outer membrane murein-binding lipoprotein Lpp